VLVVVLQRMVQIQYLTQLHQLVEVVVDQQVLVIQLHLD
jgi:hypothetical protein